MRLDQEQAKLIQSEEPVARKVSTIEVMPLHESMKSALMELLLTEN